MTHRSIKQFCGVKDDLKKHSTDVSMKFLWASPGCTVFGMTNGTVVAAAFWRALKFYNMYVVILLVECPGRRTCKESSPSARPSPAFSEDVQVCTSNLPVPHVKPLLRVWDEYVDTGHCNSKPTVELLEIYWCYDLLGSDIGLSIKQDFLKKYVLAPSCLLQRPRNTKLAFNTGKILIKNTARGDRLRHVLLFSW